MGCRREIKRQLTVWIIIVERQKNITFDKGDLKGSGIPARAGGEREENCRKREEEKLKLCTHLLSDNVLDIVKDRAT